MSSFNDRLIISKLITFRCWWPKSINTLVFRVLRHTWASFQFLVRIEFLMYSINSSFAVTESNGWGDSAQHLQTRRNLDHLLDLSGGSGCVCLPAMGACVIIWKSRSSIKGWSGIGRCRLSVSLSAAECLHVWTSTTSVHSWHSTTQHQWNLHSHWEVCLTLIVL